MKASNPKVMIQAYRLLAARMAALGMDYPFHLGVTEAGNGEDGRIKSAIGIGALLEDGIGDTIRVSLTEDPEFEVPVAYALAERYTPRGCPRAGRAASLAELMSALALSWPVAPIPGSRPHRSPDLPTARPLRLRPALDARRAVRQGPDRREPARAGDRLAGRPAAGHCRRALTDVLALARRAGRAGRARRRAQRGRHRPGRPEHPAQGVARCGT